MIHDIPVCRGCAEPVQHSAVFASHCGHERCPSSVWHGLCLMDHREKVEQFKRHHAEHGQRLQDQLEAIFHEILSEDDW